MMLFIANCLRCVAACLEKFVKFFNKHAFTEVALRSTNFCTSAATGMKVVATNGLRFGVMHGLGELVMFFATVFISSSVTILFYFIIDALGYFPKDSFIGMTFPLLVTPFSDSRSSSLYPGPSAPSSPTSGKSPAIQFFTAIASMLSFRSLMDRMRPNMLPISC